MSRRSDHQPVVHRAVGEYRERHPQLVEATGRYVEMVQALLDDAGINYLSVSGRTKSVESFKGKAERLVDGVPMHPNPIEDITDVIGVRVITYVQADVDGRRRPARARSSRSSTTATSGSRPLAPGGWATRAGTCSSRSTRAGPCRTAYEPLRRLSASVQIRTVLQHAWAEFEHDIRYKGTVPEEHAFDLDRRFTLAAGLLELADREFSAIRARLQVAIPDEPEPEEAPTRPADRVAGPRQVPRRQVRRMRGGRAPTTTPGFPGCCWSSASRRLRLSTRSSPRSTAPRSRPGWATSTRLVLCVVSMTPCSRPSGNATSTSQATRTDGRRSRVD